MRLQPIYDIAQLCAQHEINQVILCPGSRSAPLTIAFARHSDFNCRIISDERSAGFIALGIAQQTRKPVILICTSGSAAYNFAPAIAEAYFQQIPLLVFTADRPVEWIDQRDGQTIRQTKIFGQHVKNSLSIPQDYEHPDSVWHIQRIVNESINLSLAEPKGPVHVNVPLREPLYPDLNEKIRFSKQIKVIATCETISTIPPDTVAQLNKILSGYNRILVVPGQQDLYAQLQNSVRKFCKVHQAALVGDVISNFHSLPNTIRHGDVFLGHCGEDIKKILAPDLLITFGKSVISKNLKQFLRKYKPREHWHIQTAGDIADTFQSMTKLIPCNPQHFFDSVIEVEKLGSFDLQKKSNYVSQWKAQEHKTSRVLDGFFSDASFSEFGVIKKILESLPPRCNLHLANSMTVRYVNFIGLKEKNKGIHVYSNRGTSGIDGCTSTVVGHTFTSNVPNILITGDMAFFYDRNAFWHNYKMPNMHVIVINNSGGVIFNLIDGPGNLEEKDEFFITKQSLSASHLAQEFGFQYTKLESDKKINLVLDSFFKFEGTTKILEVMSSQHKSKEIFEKFKTTIKNSYDA